MKVESQMKAHFFDKKGRIFIIEFLATLELACNTNRIHERVEIWILLHHVNETLVKALKSRMCDTNNSSTIATSVRNVDS